MKHADYIKEALANPNSYESQKRDEDIMLDVWLVGYRLREERRIAEIFERDAQRTAALLKKGVLVK